MVNRRNEAENLFNTGNYFSYKKEATKEMLT